MKVTGRIERWQEINGRIWGDIYDDTEGRWEDGIFISTSVIEDSILMQDEVITTKYSTYLLGVPREV